MINLLATILLSTVINGDSSDTHLKLIDVITRNYNRKQADYNEMAQAPRYFWEIIRTNEFPYYCTNYSFDADSSEEVYLSGYGEVIRHPYGDSHLAQIAVRSYIKKYGKVDARVTRMFFYRLNSKGVWYQEKKPIKVVEEYNFEGNYFYCP